MAVHISSFCICQKLTQAGHTGTPVPCVPVCPAWEKTYPATMGGAKALLKMSCATCTAGQGKVEFMMSGQNPLSEAALRDLNEARAAQEETLKQAELEKDSVGEAGLLEGAIPVWGSGRDFIHSAQTGDKLGMALNGGFLVWDAVSVVAGALSFGTATAAMMAGKAGVRTAIKAGGHVALNAARKEAAALLARSAALHAGFKEAVLAARQLGTKLCARACFAADTPVPTRHGPRPIATLVPGDEVWAWDEATGQEDWRPVLEVFQTTAPEMAELDFGGPWLRLTPTYFLYAQPGGWVAAGDLQPGQRVQTRQGGAQVLLGKRVRVQAEPVYNLEVAGWHTYFAGAFGLLAHNRCDALTELVDIGAGVLKKRLKPNTSYLRNGYEYATDAFGRIKKASGELRLDKAARDNYMQRTVGLKDGRQAGDAGGHLLGLQFGGHGNNANKVVMNDVAGAQTILLSNSHNKGTAVEVSFQGDGSITIKSSGPVSVLSPTITLEAGAKGTIDLHAKTISLKAEQEVKIEATSKVDITTQTLEAQTTNFTAEASGQLTAKGTRAQLTGAANVDISAPLVKIHS